MLSKISWSPPDITEEDKKAMIDVINSGWISEGKVTDAFEAELARRAGAKHAIVVNNATSALIALLVAHGIRPGDEVITPAYTFIASVNTPTLVGAKSVLADCDVNTLNAAPELMKPKMTSKTKAIIPVDVCGMPVDIGAFEDFAKDNNLILIEDSAEALGAQYNGRPIGSFDHAAVFSFHIAKLCTTIEGGCIVTNDDEIAKKCRMIKNHGAIGKLAKTKFDFIGFNFRTTDVQSALGLSQLGRLEKYLAHRNKLAKIYEQELAGLAGMQFIPNYVTVHPRMFFPILVDPKKRDDINSKINAAGVDTRICWHPVHWQKSHEHLFRGQNYPNAEKIGASVITMPIGNGLTGEEVQRAIEITKKAIKSI